ncbi:amidohydrolase family protein [Vallitalea okinawensis]|uniref:amidohydrolase family protein n=1 Tax=Vallitalea okinawensis TaxID=2078660 RepID=UPI000CFDA814|nr:amidohydrolase family protein [Vallitalea okinawensis]
MTKIKKIKQLYFAVGIVLIVVVLSISISTFIRGNDKTEEGPIDMIFIEDENSLGDIYRFDSETHEIINLTNGKLNYISMAWSPDGKRIAYTKSINSQWQSYIMNDNGKELHPVKGTTSLDKVCGWSPDGRYLLLSSFRDVDREIYCLELKTGKIINLSSHPADDYMPMWSPDGEKIAFVSNRDHEGWHSLYQLYILDIKSGDVTKVVTDDKPVRSIVWSPNSFDLAIALEEPHYSTSVYLTDIESSKMDRVDLKGETIYPQYWSEDGEDILIDKIVYDYAYKPEHNFYWLNIESGTEDEINFDPIIPFYTYTFKSQKGENSINSIMPKTEDDKHIEMIEEKIALLNGTLIDGNGGTPIEDTLILVNNGFIEYVGLKKERYIPDDYKSYDLKGNYILPGFINTHVHYGFNAYNLKEWANSGVTTVRDIGADISRPLFDMRDNINSRPDYARVIMAGPMFTVPGGYPQGPWALHITSVEDAKEKTLDIINRGADVIKVAIETGEPFGEWYPILSQEELKAIVETAHSKGIKVTAHVSVSNSSNIETAINAGVDDIAHNWMTNVDDSIFNKMIDNKMYLIPTQEVLQYNSLMTKINLNNYFNLGGLIALGNDYGGDPFGKEMDLGMPMYELLSMQDSGMTPMDIIVASTKNSAIVCGREDTLGTIDEGKIADILILKENPLDQIENLEKVKMVIKDGIIIYKE